MARKNYNISDATVERLENLSRQENCSMSQIVEKSLSLYFDTKYMSEQATTIPEDIQKVFSAQTSLMESRLNNKSNQLLSEMAIQIGVLQMVVSNSLDVSPEFVEKARVRMIEYLKTNNRVFNLSQLVNEEGV